MITFPLIHLPPGGRNPNFTGREAMLARLDAQLNRGEGTAVISQTVTIAGLGGVGKTQLALEYIYQHQKEYDLVWWLRADMVLNVAADMAALAVAVGVVPAYNTDQQAAVNAARRWLAQTDKRWLLLVDNADDLPPRTYSYYLPEGGNGRILITSRNQDWRGLVGAQAVLPLDTFTPAESRAFWRRRLGIADAEEEAAVLAELLGHFPLALEHAAAYMETRQIGFAAYRQLYESKRQDVWRRATPPDRYHGTITTTWEMAFAEVKKTPGASELLNLCCFLAPENILLSLFETSDFSKKSDVFKDAPLSDPLVLNDAIAALRRYSLAKREGDNLSLHRLVQTVARDRMGPERAREWAETAVETIIELLPDEMWLHEWKEGPVIVAHMTATADLAMEQSLETEQLALLCNWTGYFLKFRADYEKARPYYERALAIREQVLGPEHPDTATSLNNLGLLLNDTGDYESAQPYLERALAIYERVLGPEHPGTATSLNNLGLLLNNIGDYEGARLYYERALKIDEKALGLEHPETATDLNNLGNLLQDMGDLEGARPYLERALAIREQVLGPEHPDTATSLNNLGSLLKDTGDYEGARPYYERTLAIDEKALGPEHPRTATDLNNLGLLLQDMGDYESARPYFERALAICVQVLGPQHPTTQTMRRNLAALDEAEKSAPY